jgi:LmbE family N-acetylglucosaminyl deacetylase
MRSPPLIAVAFLLHLSFTAAALNAARLRPALPTDPQSLLWIAAHPDDEVLAAPLLADLCIGRGVRCTFLILTRGERGACLLPAGCSPGLEIIRSAEAGSASALMQADLMLLGLNDGGSDDQSPGSWDAVYGGREALVEKIAALIRAVAPDTVLTFDPRHGSTCHPDHRRVGELAVEAVSRLAQRPALLLLETRVEISRGERLVLDFSVAMPLAGLTKAFDANLPVAGSSRTGWEWMLELMKIHRSQFDEEWLEAVRDVPELRRRTYTLPAEVALEVPLVECR